jgi:hypothetical protein
MKRTQGTRRERAGVISRNMEQRLASNMGAVVSAVRGFVSGALNLRDLRTEYPGGVERRFKEGSRCC